MDSIQTVRISPDLITLEDGGRLLLMDGVTARPLVINEGKEQVHRFLDTCQRLHSRDKILAEFPDPGLFQALFEHGIITFDKGQPQRPPCLGCQPSSGEGKTSGTSLYLLLTQYCNLGCIYCLNGSETYRKGRKLLMSEHVAFRTVEQMLDRLTANGTLEIIFFGGEPLLNWPLAKKVIEFCEQEMRPLHPDKQWRYHLTTNLTIFPDDLLDLAKQYNITFLVDIDGPEEIHNRCRPALSSRMNSYRQSVANIGKLVAAGIRPALRATITSLNVEHMEEIVLLHRELGGNSSALVPLSPVNSDEMLITETLYPDPERYGHNLTSVAQSSAWGAENLFPLNEYAGRVRSRQPMRIACGAPFGNTPVVDVNGDVYACIYLVGIPRFHLGNTLDRTYPKRELLQHLLTTLDVDNDARCTVCSYRYFCAGGCPVARLTVEGNPAASAFTLRYAREMQCMVSKTAINWLLRKMANQSLEELPPVIAVPVSGCR